MKEVLVAGRTHTYVSKTKLMKKVVTKGFYVSCGIILFLCAWLPVSAQYSGTNLETGRLYTAITKDASNNLYVMRVEAGTGGATYQIVKYTNATGTPVSIFNGLTHQIGDYPWGLAVAANGDIYVTKDFTTNGGTVMKLTNNAGSYTASGLVVGKYYSALALDANSNLYTAEYDATNKTYAVVKYLAGSTTGTKLYDNLKSAPGYTYPTGLAVAPNGDVYVADAFSNVPTITDGGHIYKLTAASSYAVSTVSTGNYATALTVDATGNLFSSENRGTGYNLVKYTNGTGAGVPVFTSLHTNGIYYPWGISVFNAGEIFVVDGDDGVHGGAVIKLTPTPPTVVTDAITSPTITSATLNGSVNDNGNTTTVNFIYGTSSTLTGATTTPATTGGTINAGSGNTPVALNITGLSASTKYYYAVSATNSGGTKQGAIMNFTTLPSISYSSPVTFSSGVTISPLSPVSSTVPAPAYGSPTVIGSGFATPFGVAADVLGNVYIADYGNKLLKKIPGFGGAPVTLATGYTTLLGVAVDGANNVYTCDAGTAIVQKIPGGGTGTPVAIGTGFSAPYGVAVDVNGNVYVADYNNSAVYKIAAVGGATTAIGTGFLNPTGVAADAAGNIYVADYGNHLVKEIPVGGGAPVTIGSGFSAPVGVAVDPSGNVFVADYGNSTVMEIPVGGGAPVSLGSGYVHPAGVAVDGFGKLDVAGYLSNNINRLKPVGGYYLSTALPSGLTLNAATGVISGKPALVNPAKNYKVTAYNIAGGTTATVNITISPNANLSNLTLSTGALTPVFVTATTSYTQSVANTVTSLTVTPTTSDAAATVTVNGTAVTSGTASGAIALNVGPNTITTAVTAQDGTTKQTYTVTVTRAPSTNDNLSAIALVNPTTAKTTVSGPDAGDYTASVGNTTASIEVMPTTAVNTSTVKVNGVTVASGSASNPIALNVGPNTITTIVTAEDGVSTKTYVITVTRAISTDATLSDLTLSSGTLSPVFASGTTGYTASVANTVTSVTATPTTTNAGAAVKVNGTAVTSGSASGSINLNIGPNTITTVVTAQDGTTTKTYTVTVTRAGSNNASLSALALVNPTTSKTTVSGPDAGDYTASVANTTTSIEVMPTTAVSTSTVKVNGTAVASGATSNPISLNVGSNTITTIVTAQDGVTTKTYVITVTRAGGGITTVYDAVSVSSPTDHPQMMGEEINVHPGLSPNGDGINDFLLIDGIGNYPDNKLSIINRSGQLIFEAKGYDNSTKVFDGHSNKNGAMQLPGTYFYTLEYAVNGITKHKTGFIVLKY